MQSATYARRILRLLVLAVLGLWFACTWADQPRVISMAPHLTELVFAAGAGETLVGVVDWSNYPPQAAKLPSIGDAFRFDLERIMALNPDIALAWSGGTPVQVVERIQQLGIEVLWIESRSLDQIAVAMETIGTELGRPARGRQAARAFRAALDETSIDHRRESRPKTVFYQVSARPLYTLGGRHVINEVFERCGLKNIFADLDTEAAVVDLESVLAAAPDLIIAGRENNDGDPLAIWRNSTLVDGEKTRLYVVEPELLVRPTPRIVEGIEFVCALAQQRQETSE